MRRIRLTIRRVYRDLGTTFLNVNAKVGLISSAISNFELRISNCGKRTRTLFLAQRPVLPASRLGAFDQARKLRKL